jgi:hypothetical protein
VEKVVKCAMAFNNTPTETVKVNWGNAIPEDMTEKTTNIKNRVEADILSKKTAIMRLDNLDESTAEKELEQINAEKTAG